MDVQRFDVVIVGSGFGGAVAACRLTQGGLRVCLLERGRRYPAGSFPRPDNEKKGLLYSECDSGLVEVKPLRTEMLALQVAGYGGGSLLYNNVQMRAAKEVFAHGWPAGFTREALDPYYDLVGYMLDIKPLSATQPLGLPLRTQLHERAAAALGRKAQFFLPNLAIDFSAPGVWHRNKFGVPQQGCNHCGECVIGCNRHAKNTLDLNYLAVAEQHGAVVRTRCVANRIEADGAGYRVSYKDLADGGTLDVVSARRVFICAGAVNSTELLLRCRDEHGTLPRISDRLGHGYSANGDFLAFIFSARQPLHPTSGPGITCALLHNRGKEWCLLEDGSVAKELVLRGQILDPRQPRIKSGRALWTDVLHALGAVAAPPSTDEVNEQCGMLLLMGRDRASGRLWLDSHTAQLRLHWELAPNLPLYSAEARLAADVAKELGGELVLNPLWKRLHQPITIHNLGGCAMSDTAKTGVVNEVGEVFGHPGLFVLDGAILPSAVGSNPSHTIAAVAERNIEAIIRNITENPGWRAPERALAPRIAEPFDRVRVPVGGTIEPVHRLIGITFDETMRGFVLRDHVPPHDYLGAERAAQACGSRMEFTLTMSAPDLDSFLHDEEHAAIATGTLHVDGFTPLEGAAVSAGVFNLFVVGDDPHARKMLYALPFYGADGNPYLLDGWKDIRDHEELNPARDAWSSMTTLYTVIRDGHRRDGAVLATGVLRIELPAVLKLSASMRVIGAASLLERAQACERLGIALFGSVWQVYVKPKIRFGER